MARVSEMAADVLLSKRVQEMVINGEEPSGQYICRVGEEEDDHDAHTFKAKSTIIPTIDLSCFLHNHQEESYVTELHKLRSALSSWGCFQAIGHGISTCFLDKILQVSREFFEQPMEEKMKYAKGVRDFEGYGGDPVPQDGQPLDWSDRLFLNGYPEDRRNYNLWPKYPHSFREVLEEYTEKMKMVTEMVSKAMAKSLHLEENCFLKQFGERSQLDSRFNYYPPCERPDLVLGLKPHSDGSGYTIIMQDEIGLQVLKDHKWFTVPKNPHALLILMADQMEIMSNGIFKSPVHRVLSSSKRDRISIAVFYTPEVGKEIGPEEGLLNEENQRVYKKVKDYADIHWENYQSGRGMRPLLHIAHV
nr:protein SRG1-like [Ipomoea batatas]